MNAKRAETSTVGISLRLREDLRQNLEQAAARRRISLNQEVIDRCEYVRSRNSMLMEAMWLGFGGELAAILIIVGAAMRIEGERRADDVDWADDAAAYKGAVEAAITALETQRPDGALPKSLYIATWDQVAREVHRLAGPTPPDRIKQFISRIDTAKNSRK